MHDIHPYKPNPFSGSLLDRVDHRRRDRDWVQAELLHEKTRFLPVWRGQNLLHFPPGQRAEAALLAHAPIAHRLAGCPWTLLGISGDKTVFTLDVSAWDDPLPLPANTNFADLWRHGAELEPADASLLAHARGLMHWRTRHRFCGICGAACAPRDAGHVMVCAGCGTNHFPRTDPAVIMLVTNGGRALLGQPSRLRDRRVFTTLAGFVEPGESLEEAVAREVFEESGVLVAHVTYHSSQPWPFPASIMLGFTAQAVTEKITIDPNELAAANWFSRDELRNPEGFALPPRLSIARRLIDEWVG